MQKRFVAMLLALIMVLGLLPVSAMAANNEMSWTWTFALIGGNWSRVDGTVSSTNEYNVNRHLDNAQKHEIGYKFEWNKSAGGSKYTGGWQLCATVDGEVVERTSAYVYTRDMAAVSGSWTAPSSSHVGNSTHRFILYLSSGKEADYRENPPSEDNFKPELDKIQVKTDCSTTGHDVYMQNLKDGTYTKVITPSKNTAVVTIKAANVNDYAASYDTEYANTAVGTHSVDTSKASVLQIVYTWNEDSETWSTTGQLYIPLKCESVQPPVVTPPVAPEAGKDFGKENAVKVECTTVGSHSETYNLIDGSYSVTPVKDEGDGTYTSTVTIYAAKYIEAYKAAHSDPEHTEVDTTSKTIDLKWTSKETGWQIVSENKTTPYATFTVKCTPPVPTTDNTSGAGNGKLAVTVKCADVNEHEEKYDLTFESPDENDITTDGEGNYFCEITVEYDDYKTDFETKHGTHELVNADDARQSVELKWNPATEEWVDKTSGEKVSVTFSVHNCQTTSTTTPVYVFFQTVDPDGNYRIVSEKLKKTYGFAYNNSKKRGWSTIGKFESEKVTALDEDLIYQAGKGFDAVVNEMKDKMTDGTFDKHSSTNLSDDVFGKLAWKRLKHEKGTSGSYPTGTDKVWKLDATLTFCEVTFDNNPQAGDTPTDVPDELKNHDYYLVGDIIVLPTLSSTNYEFKGWKVEERSGVVITYADPILAGGTSYTVSKDVKLTAQWGPKTEYVNLHFVSNGGTAVPSQTIVKGSHGTKPAPDPTRTGYTFTGWYVDPACTTLYDFDTVLTADRTVYAGWSWNYYPIYRPVKATPKFNTTDHFAYVQGYPNGSVKPTGNITRAETAAILFRLMDEGTRNTYYSTKSGFRDVSSNNWFNTYVATLNAAGVITDSANGYFRPNDAITRAELAAMLAQFADTKSAANYFNDVSANHWAANAIAVCVKLGWINGYPDGSFRPDNYITRAELMAMINRATGRTPKTADAFLNGMKTWTDNLDTTKWYYVDVQEATNSHDYIGALNEKWTALRSAPNWSVYE